jgi:hypothetical protein
MISVWHRLVVVKVSLALRSVSLESLLDLNVRASTAG